MKLYVVYCKSDQKVIAISEYKLRVTLFIEQHQFTSTDVGYFYLLDKDEITRALIKYENLILEDYCHIILPSEDMKIFVNTIKEEKDKIKNILSDLTHILKNYTLDKTETVSIKNCFDVLLKIKKKDNISNRLSIKELFLSKFLYRSNTEINTTIKNMKELSIMYNLNKE